MRRRWPTLMRAFVEARVKPYYLHHLDAAPGTSHFRTTIAEGQALMRALRGRLSGLAQPTYVLDIPGGHGKVPIGPDYLSDDGRHRRRSERHVARLSGARLTLCIGAPRAPTCVLSSPKHRPHTPAVVRIPAGARERGEPATGATGHPAAFGLGPGYLLAQIPG